MLDMAAAVKAREAYVEEVRVSRCDQIAGCWHERLHSCMHSTDVFVGLWPEPEMLLLQARSAAVVPALNNFLHTTGQRRFCRLLLCHVFVSGCCLPCGSQCCMAPCRLWVLQPLQHQRGPDALKQSDRSSAFTSVGPADDAACRAAAMSVVTKVELDAAFKQQVVSASSAAACHALVAV